MLQPTYPDCNVLHVLCGACCRAANIASRAYTRTIMLCLSAAFFVTWVVGGSPASAAEGSPTLPRSFVYLRDIDPTILQDIRYAQLDNFTGRRVPGYEAEECILLRSVAEALAQVQNELRQKQLSLKVYDCYRPAQAVRAFAAWVQAPDDGATKRFYPRLDKRSLLGLGYIGRQSGHTRGDTVDVTLVNQPPGPPVAFDPAIRYGSCTGAASVRAPDSSVDMGTGFDCFDPLSHTASNGLTSEQSHWRSTLVNAMSRRGFHNFAREWWHFTYGSGAKANFDFPIRASGRSAPGELKGDEHPADDR